VKNRRKTRHFDVRTDYILQKQVLESRVFETAYWPRIWRGVGAADRAGFENQCALMGTAGSNPALSGFYFSANITLISYSNTTSCRFFTILDSPFDCPHHAGGSKGQGYLNNYAQAMPVPDGRRHGDWHAKWLRLVLHLTGLSIDSSRSNVPLFQSF
jgi:hypothetical protein